MRHEARIARRDAGATSCDTPGAMCDVRGTLNDVRGALCTVCLASVRCARCEAPTTTQEPSEPPETTPDIGAEMEVIQAENERLQEKIDGLKAEYTKIGLQV